MVCASRLALNASALKRSGRLLPVPACTPQHRPWELASGSKPVSIPPFFPPTPRSCLTALKRYGMILAGTGPNGQISAATDVTADPNVYQQL